jgi:hypothetical protein
MPGGHFPAAIHAVHDDYSQPFASFMGFIKSGRKPASQTP